MVRTVAGRDSVHLRLVGAAALWENRMHMKRILLCLVVVATVCASTTPAQTWRQVGPPGGNVVSLAADPHNLDKLFLGTDDGGRTWNVIGLAHETVRALAQSPTDPKLLLAGAMTGVYRSTDEGASWERITPLKHPDLNRFDSLAFDPKDNNIIYAGTYHLPWKTTNGGKDWFPIIKGMIDDSDVMNIIVDPANSDNVHAVACSGMYHSLNGGVQWVKYMSIPNIYRRTQLMRMDPSNPNTLYAGTTSGLWKTVNEKDFRRLTPGDWIIN